MKGYGDSCWPSCSGQGVFCRHCHIFNGEDLVFEASASTSPAFKCMDGQGKTCGYGLRLVKLRGLNSENTCVEWRWGVLCSLKGSAACIAIAAGLSREENNKAAVFDFAVFSLGMALPFVWRNLQELCANLPKFKRHSYKS